jgi:PAS domain S-box-containing protein/putative nucleotidyltransferase with HDIG domain
MRLSAAGKVALVYALFAFLWILGGNRLLLALFPKAETLTLWQTAKGFLFVALSGLLVYLLALRETRAEEAKTRAERASARRLQALLESGRELVYLLDEKGRIRYASPNVREVLGYLPWEDPGPGPPILDYVHPEDRPLAEAALEDLLRHPGTTLEYRLRVLDKEGGVRAVRVWGRNLLQDEAVRAIVLKVQDISELVRHQDRLESVLDALPGMVFQAQVAEGEDPAYAPLLYISSQQAAALLGYPAEALLADPAFYFSQVHPEDREGLEAALRQAVAEPGRVQVHTYRFWHGKKETWVWLRDTLVYHPETRLLTRYTYEVTEEVESERRFRALAETAPALILMWQAEDPTRPESARLVYANPEALRLTGYTLEELQARPIWEFVHPQDRELVRSRGLARLRGQAPPSRYAFRILTKGGEVLWVDYSAARVELGGKPTVLGVGLDITEAKEREQTLEAFARLSLALRESEDLREMMQKGLDTVMDLLGAGAGSVLIYEGTPPRLRVSADRGWMAHLPPPSNPPEAQSLAARALAGEVILSPDPKTDPRLWEAARPFIPEGWGVLALPLLAGREAVGVLFLSWPRAQLPGPREVERAQILGEVLGNALRRGSLRAKLAQRVAQLEALRAVDQAIAASLDLGPTLEVLLAQALRLPLDAAAFFLYRKEEGGLVLEACKGFLSPKEALPKRIPLGVGPVGQAALEAQVVHVQNLAQNPGTHPEFPLREGLVSERAYPLFAKGRLLGVLAAFTRKPWDLAPEEEEFLEALVAQGAIALDNALTFQALQKTQQELEAAYDLTLWGWAKAVELRDQETAGHTERVTALTLRLARALGVPEEDLEHIRRGAILHDVGKLAIPDRILLKPGPLTEEEWAVMKRHPVHAYEWLSGIPFLRKALDIPYAHHERWDGSGYPRGLKGEAIPLFARIFAVVDIYDALTSDRPYRKAWPKEKALAYLREQAGRQFDPQVVATFLRLVEEEGL